MEYNFIEKRSKRKKHPSKAKARKILHEGRAHGRPLTKKQRRYFAWLAYSKNDISHFESRGKTVLRLLKNYNDKKDIKLAIVILTEMYNIPESEVIVKFGPCKNSEYAYANSYRIYVCDKIRTREYDESESHYIQHKKYGVGHFAATILHEFGHVLDKNGKLHFKNMVLNHEEERADFFASNFIKKNYFFI